MPDLFELVKRWWKYMLIAVILSVMVVGTITFLKPRQYLSVATAVPASSFATDKAAIFNENIQYLYSSMGGSDDLDRVIGTADLDTVYLAITDQFNLFDHYRSGTAPGARTKAARQLKQNSRVIKSGYGELKVKVWDTDKGLAPQLANAIFEKLETIHRDLQSKGNESTLKGLKTGQEKLQMTIDSINGYLRSQPEAGATDKLVARRNSLDTQLQQYEKLASEYQLMIDSKPPSLILVERAKPAERPDRPKRLQTMIATAALSLLFSLLLALVLDRQKKSRP